MTNNQFNILKCFNDNNRCRPLNGAITSNTSANNIQITDTTLNPGCYHILYPGLLKTGAGSASSNIPCLIHVPYRGRIKLNEYNEIILSADNGKYMKITPYILNDTFTYNNPTNVTLNNTVHAILDGFNIYGRSERTTKTSITDGATSLPISSVSLTIDNNENIIELPTVLRDLPNNIGIHDECILNFKLQIQNLIIRIGRCILGGLSFEVIENKSDNNSTLLFAKYDAIATCPTNESQLWCSHLVETTYNNIMVKEIYDNAYISLSRDIDGSGLYIRIPTTIASKKLCMNYLHSRISTDPIVVEYPLSKPQYKVNLLKNYNFKTNYNSTSLSIDNYVENIMYRYMNRRI